MVVKTFSFRGQKRDYIVIHQQRKRPAWAPIKRNILTVPNRPGGYHKSTDVDIRTLEIPILFFKNERMDIQKIKEDLAEWLITESVEELIFDDEPDRSYFAMIDGSLDLDELIFKGEGVLTFVCPDPYKYGLTKIEKTQIQSDGSSSLVARNNGSVIAQPVFEVEVDNQYTYIDVTNGSKVNRVGRIVNIDDYAVSREEMVLNDPLSTLTGWAKTEGSTHIDGLATGNMKVDAGRFVAADFGTTVTAWHGPYYKKSLGQTLTDFKIETMVELVNTGEDKFGKVEIYLLDENNLSVCMLTIKDVDSSGKRIYATLRTGGGDQGFTDIISTHGATESTFWNFYGMLRIERVGTRWTAYVAKVDKTTGAHTARAFEIYNDNEQQFMRKPTQVGIYIAQYGERKVASLRAHDVKVSKINTLTDNQIPYIVNAGDKVTFDHNKEVILINGEPRMDLKAFSGDFFGLEKGTNTISVSPALPMKATWRERYL